MFAPTLPPGKAEPKPARPGKLFSCVGLGERVPAKTVNATLAAMSGAFEAPHSPFGRASIPPERLPRAPLPRAF
jgi:hypothetical protein